MTGRLISSCPVRSNGISRLGSGGNWLALQALILCYWFIPMPAGCSAGGIDQESSRRERQISEQRQLGLADRRSRIGAELAVELRQREYRHVAPKHGVAEARLGRREARIKDRPRVKRRKLERQAQPDMAPEAKADFHGISKQRQVANVHNEVEQPVRERGTRDHRKSRGFAVAPEENCDSSKRDRKRERADQAMRVGHVVKIHRIGFGEAFDDAQSLDAQHDKHRPDDVEPLHRNEQKPERQARMNGFRGKGNAVMSDEHEELRWLWKNKGE